MKHQYQAIFYKLTLLINCSNWSLTFSNDSRVFKTSFQKFIFQKINILASTWTFLRAAVGSNLHLSIPVLFSKIYRLILMSSSNVTQATYIYIYEELCDIIAKDTTLFKMHDTKPDKFILCGMSLCETRHSALGLSWPLITLGLYMITIIILWKIR